MTFRSATNLTSISYVVCWTYKIFIDYLGDILYIVVTSCLNTVYCEIIKQNLDGLIKMGGKWKKL